MSVSVRASVRVSVAVSEGEGECEWRVSQRKCVSSISEREKALALVRRFRDP